ncbi:hypothetical protein [Nocardia cyriacigeorgica]|uniref:hypothetical protein n=1 Tax=Nocardia cyriacigeorgica TaxID=135487 RepID=UPI000CEA321A|nr:hypothetical protein [Nocardia cyriacigeorgica]AVH21995.1 hypothetical protein C5B73_11600 [Nocardia cyriacigeorgica]PPJ11543.1 hypothetical protein C5E43_11540 [Nocardia cyriacigeorgica]
MTAPEPLRAPAFSFVWTWWPTGVGRGVAAQFELAERLASCADRHGLLSVQRVSCRWLVEGRIVPGAQSSVAVAADLTDPAVPARLEAARPAEVPDHATIGAITVTGPGTRFDAACSPHSDDDLVRMGVDLTGSEPIVDLEVHHDIWLTHDFHGRPQPEVHRGNAPRLAATLADFDAVLGVAVEPGPPSNFGTPQPRGIEPPLDDDGAPMDVTEWL